MTPETFDMLLAAGLFACSLGVLAVNRRVRRLDEAVTARLRAGGYYGPPRETERR